MNRGSEPRALASGTLILDAPAEGVARLRIDNPERRGALDQEILDALAETVGALDARCLVLTGTGHVFSSGYDLSALREEELAAHADELVAHPFNEALAAIEGYGYPVIAQLNGHTIGGGLELAVTCDIRVAARGIRVGMPPAKLGLVYSHTGLRKFLDLCGPANTAELFYIGRNVKAHHAKEMGLVNQVVEPDELERRTTVMARVIAEGAPLSLAGNKRVIRELRTHAAGLPADVEGELIALREACFETEDFREGVRAFTEKRPPEWKGR